MKSTRKTQGTYHIFCVSAEANFEGGGGNKKADLVKEETKFGRNIVRGERNYQFVQGGEYVF